MTSPALHVPNGIAGLDSSSLIARARAGDGESFCTLCGPCQDRLFRQALALCRDEHFARDLAQETLVEGWKSFARYNGKCQLNTWLCSILLNRYRSHLRRVRWKTWMRSFTGQDDEATLKKVKDPGPAPDKASELSDEAQIILGSLGALSPRHREVIFLRFYADESLEGISMVLGCSVGTVKSRLFHALENLRKMKIYQEEWK